MHKAPKKPRGIKVALGLFLAIVILTVFAETGPQTNPVTDASQKEASKPSIAAYTSSSLDPTEQEGEASSLEPAVPESETSSPQNTAGTTNSDAPTQQEEQTSSISREQKETGSSTLDAIPTYTGKPFVEINNNTPFFTEADRARGAFEEYSKLDEIGRAGVAFARISPDTMPTSNRSAELQYKPSGWHGNTYDFVDHRYLYNRCHLIAWSLAAEGDNPQNLITGTRTMNMEGMRPFEEQVSRYVHRTNNSVLYRVTPIYWANNLVANGVLIEAESIEDGGTGVCFCVYCFNVEPGVAINYATGENEADGTRSVQISEPSEEETQADFIINKKSQVYHYPDCKSVTDMRDYNKIFFQGTLEELQAQYAAEDGWRLCKMCREKHGQ